MIRPLLRAAAITAAFSATALADEHTQVDELARQYVDMPQIQKMISDMFAPEMMVSQLEANLPPTMTLTPDQRAQIGPLMAGAMNGIRPHVESVMIAGTAKHFSADELRALIDFYGSEHGAAIMTKMQPYMQDVMFQLGPEIQIAMMAINPQLTEIMQGD